MEKQALPFIRDRDRFRLRNPLHKIAGRQRVRRIAQAIVNQTDALATLK